MNMKTNFTRNKYGGKYVVITDIPNLFDYSIGNYP